MQRLLTRRTLVLTTLPKLASWLYVEQDNYEGYSYWFYYQMRCIRLGTYESLYYAFAPPGYIIQVLCYALPYLSPSQELAYVGL